MKKQNDINYIELSKSEIENIVKIIIDSIEDREFLLIFKNSNRYSHYLDRMKQIAISSIEALIYHQRCGEFKIIASEFSFGENDLSKIVINIDDKNEIIITGKVDRVDIYADGQKKYVKVLDFKTGSKTLKENDIEKGVQLQLLTYLDIILKTGNELFNKGQDFEYLPGGVYYFEIKNAVLTEENYKEKVIKDKLNSTQIKELLLKEFMLDGLTYEDIDLIKKIDNKIGTNNGIDIISKSDIIKAEITKKGELSKRSNVANEDKFNELRNIVNENIYNLSKDIFSGKIDINYNKANEFGSCNYCDYSAICKRDTKN